ncbi:Uncharacterised protein [Actinomadura madurae]|nr:Uncharacterised protein [Actinomadura madurae]
MTFREYPLSPSDFSVVPVAAWNRALAEEADLDQAVELLRRRYPGLCIYRGEYTGSLWALLPDHKEPPGRLTGTRPPQGFA